MWYTTPTIESRLTRIQATSRWSREMGERSRIPDGDRLADNQRAAVA
jgi:hypothetical protein